jgi:hypothetical protein
MLRHAGGVAGQVDHHAVRGDDPLQPLRLAKLQVLAKVAVLAVHGDQELRLHEVVEGGQVRPVRVARHMIAPALVIEHVDTLLG